MNHLKGYNTNTGPWTIVGNMIGECHTPCTLNTSFIDFTKEYVHDVAVPKSKLSFSTKPSIPFQLQSKVVDLVNLSFLYNVYTLIIELVLILNITEILLTWR